MPVQVVPFHVASVSRVPSLFRNWMFFAPLMWRERSAFSAGVLFAVTAATLPWQRKHETLA